MQDVLQGLRKDHRDILRLLDAFARELSLLDADGEPDYALLEDILRYSLDYPDQTHHRTEEYLLQELLQEYPDVRDILCTLRGEHEDLRSAALDILDLLRHILDGQIVDKMVFSRNCRGFIENYVQHIRREEALVFPLVEDVLSACENFNIPRVTAENPASDEVPDSVRARLRLVVTEPD
ncbi:MAG: hemerythrin domain-containing protein [Rhodospirillales bacterium]